MRYGSDEFSVETLLPLIGKAEDRLARLDERVARSTLGGGFRERAHFIDVTASMWLAGELVHLEDLVLHDAGMDIRRPTHELTQAHTILRCRRRLCREAPKWALSEHGFASLRGRSVPSGRNDDDVLEEDHDDDFGELAVAETDDTLADQYAQLDAALASADRVLEGRAGSEQSQGLVYDPDWDEESRIADWRAIFSKADGLPPTLAAAILWEAWERIEPLQRQHWLGNLLVGAYLRSRGKIASHLLGLSVGLKTIPRERRRARSCSERIAACLDGLIAAADSGLETLNRLHLAKSQMEHRLQGRRSSSSLPEVVDLLFSRPIVSVGMVAKFAKVTPRGALNLIGEIGVREITGRGRYRAWGVI